MKVMMVIEVNEVTLKCQGRYDEEFQLVKTVRIPDRADLSECTPEIRVGDFILASRDEDTGDMFCLFPFLGD